jgi:hypothetical protein
VSAHRTDASSATMFVAGIADSSMIEMWSPISIPVECLLQEYKLKRAKAPGARHR